ncbi:MAG: hypothetical protein JSV36_06040 [Anaerolineae bacterium]|nr:MAG: hypothetical protein JSV36_06040 [Anaerolineae bacterium]
MAMSADLLRYVGWATYASAAATLVTFVTGILFFTVGQPFGTIQDATSALQVFLMLPIAAVLLNWFRPDAPVLSTLATIVGVVGMLVAGVLQVLLVFRAVRFESTIGTGLAAGGVIGAWLVVINGLGLASGAFPNGLAWSGIVAGGGYVLLVIGFWLGGQQHPLFWGGSLATVIGYVVWAMWLGRVLLSGAIASIR